MVITRFDEPVITVDDLEVAQLLHLLLNNEKIRDVISIIGEKGVLILGRFTEVRKAVLDAIRKRLPGLGFVPMMFDFQKPKQREFTEPIKRSKKAYWKFQRDTEFYHNSNECNPNP